MAVAMNYEMSYEFPKANIEDEVFRGDIWMVDFSGSVGAEQFGVRPSIVFTNNLGNKYSPVVTVIPITSSMIKKPLPVHVYLAARLGFQRDSVALCEQMKSIDKGRLMYRVGSLNDEVMDRIETAVKINLGLMPLH